jgi:probable H4MPT-linked C1 transfer pathway protein
LIDVGSTTCDVVPLWDGRPAAKGTTDTQRLLAGELVYTGIERSPICALVNAVPYRGQSCPVVQEVFATMRDAYMILDRISDDSANTQTSDGKPATRPFARARLARMIAADAAEFNHRDAVALAQAAAEAQVALLAKAIAQAAASLPARPDTILLSGHGEFLAREALDRAQVNAKIIALSKELGSAISRSAPAHALAVLASELAAQ